jgi:uncharacterized LabA/DUF88 family protein
MSQTNRQEEGAMSGQQNRVPEIRAALVVDGGFLKKVSNYYMYDHALGRRLNLQGLQGFAQRWCAGHSGAGGARSPRVRLESHYFSGRFTTAQFARRVPDHAQRLAEMEKERRWEDQLIHAGYQLHHVPMSGATEKGVDVTLALSVADLVRARGLDVVLLITGDGDFEPLAVQLRQEGVEVVLLAWNVRNEQSLVSSYTSASLANSVSTCLRMERLIENAFQNEAAIINLLFLPRRTPINQAQAA